MFILYLLKSINIDTYNNRSHCSHLITSCMPTHMPKHKLLFINTHPNNLSHSYEHTHDNPLHIHNHIHPNNLFLIHTHPSMSLSFIPPILLFTHTHWYLLRNLSCQQYGFPTNCSRCLYIKVLTCGSGAQNNAGACLLICSSKTSCMAHRDMWSSTWLEPTICGLSCTWTTLQFSEIIKSEGKVRRS